MKTQEIDINRLSFVRAKKENISIMLDIIRRCVLEINSVDYTQVQIRELLDGFTAEWLEDIINTRHYYEVWYDGTIVACGGVSRDYSQEKQSYFSAVFVSPDFYKKGIGRKLVEFLEKDEWCLDSNLIEIPSSKSSHEFYYKCGYRYREYPPVFKDGTTIMYKQK
jgi:N-acetylglutamate synthase-like GNAT family acetyltransferase